MNSPNNNLTKAKKVEILDLNKYPSSLGFINIDSNTTFHTFLNQINQLYKINKEEHTIQFKYKGHDECIESTPENFHLIKKGILNPSRKTQVSFIIQQKDKSLINDETEIKRSINDESQIEYLNILNDLDFSELRESIWKDPKINESENSTSQLNKYEGQHFDQNMFNSKGQEFNKHNLGNEPNYLPKITNLTELTKLTLDGEAIKIKQGFEDEFIKNIKHIKCSNCSNYLFGLKTCKHCSLNFCYKCVPPNSKNQCPTEDCNSIIEETDINEFIKKKLCRIKLKCDNGCEDDDDLSIFNYLEHRKICKGIII